jgi:serine/threonine protein kinase
VSQSWLTNFLSTPIQKRINAQIALHHQNIIKLYDCFWHVNLLVFVMEFADSGDLSRYLVPQKPEYSILFYFTQIVEGIENMHANELSK